MFLLKNHHGLCFFHTQITQVASPRLQVDELQSAGTGTCILVADSTQVMAGFVWKCRVAV